MLAPSARALVLIDDPERAWEGLSPAGLDATHVLTAGEAPVAALAAEALTVREIAVHVGLSPNTVKTHLKAIYGKLGVTGQAGDIRQVMARHRL